MREGGETPEGMSRCVPTIGWVLEVPTPVDVVTSEDATRGEKRGNLWMKTSLDCHWDLSLVLHIYKESMLQSASVAVGKRRKRDTAGGVGEPCKVGHPILHQMAADTERQRTTSSTVSIVLDFSHISVCLSSSDVFSCFLTSQLRYSRAHTLVPRHNKMCLVQIPDTRHDELRYLAVWSYMHTVLLNM